MPQRSGEQHDCFCLLCLLLSVSISEEIELELFPEKLPPNLKKKTLLDDYLFKIFLESVEKNVVYVLKCDIIIPSRRKEFSLD